MQHWLDKLTDLAAIEGDECILKTGLADFAEHFGFTGFAYLHIQHKHIIAVTNYHREWQSTYFDKKFDALDPVVKRARSRKHVFAWSGEQERPGLSKEERAFYAHAADYGIFAQLILDQCRQSIMTFTEVDRLGRDHDPYAVR
ncbi:transcriptional regulator TraR, partial [Agrobacterium rhizogenes]|nr:transcriptional regulator TraR [Rhizobium rhizogenes]NTI53090.1 transcriptional regulator TraR [Rhizobium rhizogenes]